MRAGTSFPGFGSISAAAILRRWQARLFLLLFAVIVCAPAVLQVAAPEFSLIPRSFPFAENRALAEAPPWPRSVDDAMKYPLRLDPFVRDHFGLRADLITLNNWLRFRLFHEFTSRQIVLGEHGRVLLTSHDAGSPFSMIRGLCGVGVSDEMVAGQGAAIGELLQRTRQAAHAPVAFVLAPSATAVYPETMPPWLARQCRAAQPSVPRVAARIPPSERQFFLYLGPAAAKIRETVTITPIASFHWWGAGPKRLIETMAETLLGQTRRIDVPMHDAEKGSDLGQFMPGLVFREKVKEPDWAAAGIERCFGPSCFTAELGPIASILADLSRYRAPGAGTKRVLMLSDSYGAMSAGYLAEFYGEVLHLSTNNLERLSVEQMRTLRRVVFEEYRPDQVVYLYHDAAVLYAAGRLNRLLWQ